MYHCFIFSISKVISDLSFDRLYFNNTRCHIDMIMDRFRFEHKLNMLLKQVNNIR